MEEDPYVMLAPPTSCSTGLPKMEEETPEIHS